LWSFSVSHFYHFSFTHRASLLPVPSARPRAVLDLME
jgi:hypothetical protein